MAEVQRSALQQLPPVGDFLIRALALSPDKQRLAIGTGAGVLGRCSGNCAVQLLELPSGRVLWQETKFAEDIKALTFTPDGKALISAGNGESRKAPFGAGCLRTM